MYAHRPALCVYCGSRFGTHPAHAETARRLGRALAEAGWSLVYGGGNVGLMGAVADAARAGGAPVLGVIPESLMRREVGHTGLSELRVVGDMHARKLAMAEAADAFVALPGGIGTLEEIFEVWSWRHLGYHDKPVALLDVGGYYQPLLTFLRQGRQEGFIDVGQADGLQVFDRVDTLLTTLRRQLDGAAGADYRQI